MKSLTEGHLYLLDNFENPTETGQTLQFIEKQAHPNPEFDGQLFTVNNGTTNEEVLGMLIDRMKYLQSRYACRENAITITKLEEALMWQNKRTEDRQKRKVEGKHLE